MRFLFFLSIFTGSFLLGHTQWKFEYAPIERLSSQVTDPNNAFQIQMYATSLAINQQYLLATFQWDKLARKANYDRDSLERLYRSAVELPAPATITRLASENQILLLDELHHLPQHRVFLHSLLKELYQNGYRYLALEALFEDIMPQKKLTTASGVYTKEPHFANMIREALRLGFVVMNYEGTDFSTNTIRDSIAASNILQKWKPEDGKLIVYGGPAHIITEENSWGKSVGYWLKQAGYKTLSVSQTAFFYSDQVELVHPFHLYNKQKYPVVLSVSDQKYFTTKKGVDVVLIHPLTQMNGGLPNWYLNLHPSLQPIPLSAIFEPTVASYLKLYDKNDYSETSVPLGIYQVTPGMQQNLLLRDGNYVLEVEQIPLTKKIVSFTVKNNGIVQ